MFRISSEFSSSSCSYEANPHTILSPPSQYLDSTDPRIVTVCWIELCIFAGEVILPADRLLEKPLPYTVPVPSTLLFPTFLTIFLTPFQARRSSKSPIPASPTSRLCTSSASSPLSVGLFSSCIRICALSTFCRRQVRRRVRQDDLAPHSRRRRRGSRTDWSKSHLREALGNPGGGFELVEGVWGDEGRGEG